MSIYTLSVGADHGGVALKQALLDHLHQSHPHIAIIDHGTNDTTSVNYPSYARLVAHDILNGIANGGLLVCGTGIGMSIQANRFKGIRASLVTSPFLAEMTRRHNDSNILCLGGRTTTIDDAKLILDTWLSTPFEAGRHAERIQQLDL